MKISNENNKLKKSIVKLLKSTEQYEVQDLALLDEYIVFKQLSEDLRLEFLNCDSDDLKKRALLNGASTGYVRLATEKYKQLNVSPASRHKIKNIKVEFDEGDDILKQLDSLGN